MKKLKIAAAIVLGLCGFCLSMEMLTWALARGEVAVETANLDRLNKSLGTSYTTQADALAEYQKRLPVLPPVDPCQNMSANRTLRAQLLPEHERRIASLLNEWARTGSSAQINKLAEKTRVEQLDEEYAACQSQNSTRTPRPRERRSH
jgi:hypothetical protein